MPAHLIKGIAQSGYSLSLPATPRLKPSEGNISPIANYTWGQAVLGIFDLRALNGFSWRAASSGARFI